MATNAGDVVLIGAAGALLAYVTNFLGFRAWADTNLIQQPPTTNPDPQPQPEPLPQPDNKCISSVCKNTCQSKFPSSTWTINPKCDGIWCYCNQKKKVTTPPPPTSCTGPCPQGQTPAVVNGRCGCKACAPCKAPCYVRGVSGCSCKLNENALFHNDGTCTMSCGGRACWYNYPCGGSSKVKICVNGGCAEARAAFLAKYGCKTTTAPPTSCEPYLVNRCKSICSAYVGTTPYLDSKCSCFCRKTSNVAGVRSYQANRPYEQADEGLMQVPTIA